MLKLLRYFALTSLLAFAIVVVALGTLYRQSAVRELIRLEENKNVALARAYANSLWDEMSPVMQHPSSGESMVDHHVQTLRSSVIALSRGLNVAKVKMYDTAGMTVFSTEAAQIGQDGSANAGFVAALQGNVISELTHRDSFSAFEGTIEDQDVLATYIPVLDPTDGTTIVGVFELYTNVTSLLDRIDRTQRSLVLGVTAVLGVLYLFLLVTVGRAERIMRRQAAEQAEVEEALRAEQRMVAVLWEREQLARELHDGLGQILGFVKMQAHAALESLGQEQVDTATAHMARLLQIVRDSHADVRETIVNLHAPQQLESDFYTLLSDYLERFQAFSGIETATEFPQGRPELELDPLVAVQVIRIVQEALTNVRKHARAQRVLVAVEAGEELVTVRVADDGRGFAHTNAPATDGTHFGLKIMRDRAAECGGTVDVISAPDAGATVRIVVPRRGIDGDHARPAGADRIDLHRTELRHG